LRTLVSLKSTWKAYDAPAEGWAVVLGPSTCLTGPNAAGKSRVPEALALLLTGAVSNYVGRPSVSDPRMLWRSKPKGAPTLWVEGLWSDGDVVKWEQARSNGRPTVTLNGAEVDATKQFGAVLGVEEVRANLFASPKRAEAWLSGKLGITTTTVLAVVPPEAAGRQTVEAVAALNEDPNEVLKTLKGRAKAASDEYKIASQVTEEIEATMGPVVTTGDIEQAEAAVQAAHAATTAARAETDAVGNLRNAVAAGRQAQAALATLPAVNPAAEKQIKTANMLLTVLTTIKAQYGAQESCPCCKSAIPLGRVDERIVALTAFAEQGRMMISAIQQRRVQEGTVKQASNDMNEAMTTLGRPTLDALRSGRWADQTAACAATEEAARTTLAGLQAKIVGAQAPGMAEDRAVAAKERSDRFGSAVKAWETAQAKAVRNCVKALNVGVKEFFPSDTFGTPALTLRPKVEVSLKKNGEVVVPSGAPETLLLMALAAFFAKLEADVRTIAAEEGDAEALAPILPVIVAEDRSLTAETLAAMFDAFKDWQYGHVFVPTAAHTSPGDGWTTVNYWKLCHKAEAAAAAPIEEIPAWDPLKDIGTRTNDAAPSEPQDAAAALGDDFGAVMDSFLSTTVGEG